MIQIISGSKGKGKTKYLIQMANDAVKTAEGNVVYLDKNNKHMYELSNRIRLINVGLSDRHLRCVPWFYIWFNFSGQRS